MKIQINTDKNISGHEALTLSIEDILRPDLSRFSDQITRIEVHLSDENSAAKSGTPDKRCLLEVRLAGEHPISVSEQAQTISTKQRRRVVVMTVPRSRQGRDRSWRPDVPPR